MKNVHHYKATVAWTGNRGEGTQDYSAYSRNHDILVEGKPVLHGSSDPSFRGDKTLYSPEDLLVSSLSACHMLWYLHLCSVNGIVVVEYTDNATGEMVENEEGSGQFSSIILNPRVTVTHPSMFEKAQSLHAEAHKHCFIARSVNFPVLHQPEVACYEKA